jgi:hypothetical protein
MQNLPKHEKYKNAYIPNDYYWGIGVEHEVYLESTQKTVPWKLDDALTKTKPERYSVRYLDVYRDGVYERGMRSWFEAAGGGPIQIPVLMNSHSLQKTDIELEHSTTYTKDPNVNPKFDGMTVIDRLRSLSDYFRSEYEKSYIFDGDTVEFATLGYYKARVEDVLDELEAMESRFIGELNKGLATIGGKIWGEYGPFCIMRKNYPCAVYLTNLQNIALFNNGTIHLNLTLPTRLNEKGNVADRVQFMRTHQLYARLIQWMEPFWVAMYGSADPFGGLVVGAPRGSQRCGVMRYIGVGTYNTKAMNHGKILQIDCSANGAEVYGTYNSESCYVGLKKIGLDINFQKHYNHGLELRFLDHMPRVALRNIMNICVYLMDHLLGGENEGRGDNLRKIRDPHDSSTWKTVVCNALRDGHKGMLSVKEQISFGSVFGCTVFKKEKSFREFYAHICTHLAMVYGTSTCATMMLGRSSSDEKEIVDIRPAEKVEGGSSAEKADGPTVSSVPWWMCFCCNNKL